MEKSLDNLIKQGNEDSVTLSKVFDAILIPSSLWLYCWIYGKNWNDHIIVAFFAIFLFVFIGEFTGLYRAWRTNFLHEEFIKLSLVWSTVVLVLLLLGYATKTSSEYSRLAIGTWLFTVPFILCLWRSFQRFIAHGMRSRGYNTRSVAIVGGCNNTNYVAQTIIQSPWMGLCLFGVFDDRTPLPNRILWPGPIKGNFDQLLKAAHSGEIDVIYITLPLSAISRISPLIDELADTTASVYIVPEISLGNMFSPGRWVNLGNLPTISIYETPFYGLDGWVKRVQDIIVASVILLLISIPMLLIAIGVKFSSPGPVLFKQKRYGLDGKEIEVWKFRTMNVCEEGNQVSQATRNDPRVTLFGALLRRTSLDELPQFINVLQGTMSVVGPRPHAIIHNEHYRFLIRGYMLRHKVKPGITGWAQINGWRGQTTTLDKMDTRIRHDLWYIRNWSLWLDFKIILLTIFRGFYSKDAF